MLGLEIPASMNRHSGRDAADAIDANDDVIMHEPDLEPEFNQQPNDNDAYYDGDVAMNEFDQQSDEYDAQFDDDVDMDESNQ